MEVAGEGLPARCLLHEVDALDHLDGLDGVVYLDRLHRDTRKAAMRAVHRRRWFSGAPA